MPRGRKKSPNSMSISELEALLDDQRAEREGLEAERSKLQSKLNDVEERIKSLDGAGAAGGKRGRKRGAAGGTSNGKARKRPKNDMNLPDAMEQVLKGAGEPLGVSDIAAKVQESGYASSSANFRGIVNQQLIKDDRFTSVSRGVYGLK